MDYLDNGCRVVRIVVTGGPCSGKSTALERTFRELEGEGYHILLMPETATQLISNGISPAVCSSLAAYQRIQIPMQLAKEKVYALAAEEIYSAIKKPILIIYDRGMLDNKAYMEDEAFARVVESQGLTEGECLSWYDAVFHLSTAAKGAQDFYTCDNNSARMETPDEAILVDDSTLHAWEAHPMRVIIDNSTGFEEKMDRLFDGIRKILSDIAKTEETL